MQTFSNFRPLSWVVEEHCGGGTVGKSVVWSSMIHARVWGHTITCCMGMYGVWGRNCGCHLPQGFKRRAEGFPDYGCRYCTPNTSLLASAEYLHPSEPSFSHSARSFSIIHASRNFSSLPCRRMSRFLNQGRRASGQGLGLTSGSPRRSNVTICRRLL